MRRRSSAVRFGVVAAVVAVLIGATACDPVPKREASGSLRQVWVTGLDPSQEVRLLATATSTTPLQVGAADAQGSYVFYGVSTASEYWVYAPGSADYDPAVKVLGVTDETMAPSSGDYDSWIANPGPTVDRPLVSTLVEPGVINGPTDSPTFGFLPVRDSTALAWTAAVPPGTCLDDDDTGCKTRPTILMYSPYGITSSSCWDHDGNGGTPNLCEPDVSRLARAFTSAGYAFVGLELRGTNCSGGAYDGSGRLIGTDGYDAVETLARQPWSTGSVGMYGFSAIGLSAAPVAALRPPHLAGLAIGGVGDAYGAIHPGGMSPFGVADASADVANDGSTTAEDLSETEYDRYDFPGTDTGRTGGESGFPTGNGFERSYSWVVMRFLEGDTEPSDLTAGEREDTLVFPANEADEEAYAEQCTANQALHGQRSFLRTSSGQQAHVDENTMASLRSATRVADSGSLPFPQYAMRDITGAIQAPVLLSATFQDALIPASADVVNAFPNAETTWAILSNGLHQSLFDNSTAGKEMLDDFFRLYVARMPSTWNGTDQATLAGASTPGGVVTEQAAAEAEPIAVQWSWAGTDDPGTYAGDTVVTRHAAVPGTSTVPSGFAGVRLYATSTGRLDYPVPTATDGTPAGKVTYTEDPGARNRLGTDGSSLSRRWPQHVSGATAQFETSEALGNAGFWVAGPVSADLWVKSSTSEANLQVSLSEVRADGSEVLLQTGWRRASRRQLAGSSTALLPVFTDATNQPLTPGAWTEVRVSIPTTMAVLHPGSRLRISISAPGGDSVNRVFDEDTSATVDIGTSSTKPSSIYVPVMTALPSNDEGATTLAQLYGKVVTYRAVGIGCNPAAWPSSGYYDSIGNPCRAYLPASGVPTGITATPISGGVRVTWSHPASGTPTQYRVYSGTPGSNLADATPTTISGSTTTIDIPASTGTPVAVRVAAVNSSVLAPLSVQVKANAG